MNATGLPAWLRVADIVDLEASYSTQERVWLRKWDSVMLLPILSSPH